MKETSKEGTPLSVLLFGAALGTAASTILHTNKGKQLVHDATSVFDDLVSLLEHVLDDDVSFEESLEGVKTFNDHVLDKLDRVNAFNAHSAGSAQKSAPQGDVPVRVVPSTTKTQSVTPRPAGSVIASQATAVSHVPQHSVQRPQMPVRPKQPASALHDQRSAFMYHAPVPQTSAKAHPEPSIKKQDPDVALLHKIGNRMFR